MKYGAAADRLCYMTISDIGPQAPVDGGGRSQAAELMLLGGHALSTKVRPLQADLVYAMLGSHRASKSRSGSRRPVESYQGRHPPETNAGPSAFNNSQSGYPIRSCHFVVLHQGTKFYPQKDSSIVRHTERLEFQGCSSSIWRQWPLSTNLSHFCTTCTTNLHSFRSGIWQTPLGKVVHENHNVTIATGGKGEL